MSTTKPSKAFWIISGVALLWNAMGVNQYLQQAYMTDAFKAMYTEEQLAIITSAPSWVIAVFAIAVFGGLLGSLALLLRKKIAIVLFIVSLIGIIAQMYHNLFVIDSVAIYGPGAAIMPIMVIAFALFLLWFSKFSDKKNWLS
ncbi:hypothetical protein [Flavobacterium sp.]|uniref:hypothetical protein n=1 Tax=Flavobacterium sp. TaxID=239 RepID=UPI003D2D7C52